MLSRQAAIYFSALYIGLINEISGQVNGSEDADLMAATGSIGLTGLAVIFFFLRFAISLLHKLFVRHETPLPFVSNPFADSRAFKVGRSVFAANFQQFIDNFLRVFKIKRQTEIVNGNYVAKTLNANF